MLNTAVSDARTRRATATFAWQAMITCAMNTKDRRLAREWAEIVKTVTTRTNERLAVIDCDSVLDSCNRDAFAHAAAKFQKGGVLAGYPVMTIDECMAAIFGN